MNAEILVSNYPSAGAVFTVLLDEEAVNNVYLSDSTPQQIYFDKNIIIMACKSLMPTEDLIK